MWPLSFTLPSGRSIESMSNRAVNSVKEGHFIVYINAILRTAISESLRMGARVTQGLPKLNIVQSIALRVGPPIR